MPNSYNTITLQGLGYSTGLNGWDQKVFGPFDFDYISKDDIKLIFKESGEYQSIAIASVDPVTKLVTIVDDNLPFTMSPAVVPGGTEITSATARIYRSTSLSPIVDFQSGSRISESDLDTAYRQALFASQEAVEDASASGTRTLQATDDIVDGAVTALKLASNAVETAKIKDLNVTAGKLEEDLDLSNNTVILPNGAVTTTKILDANVTFPKLGDVINDNTMATAGTTNVATSSSIKAYVDSNRAANIVQAVKTDIYTHDNPQNAWYDIPDLSVQITPKFSNSKILISSSVSNSTNDSQYGCVFRYVRDNTPIALGDQRGNRTSCTFAGGYSGGRALQTSGMDYLDNSSLTTGVPVTYKIQVTCETTVDIYINRTFTNGDSNDALSGISTLTVTEVYQ